MPYFGEPVGRVKIQTTSKNAKLVCSGERISWIFIYIYRECVIEVWEAGRNCMAREIKLTDWSMAGNLSNRSSGVQIPRDSVFSVICTLGSVVG